MVRKLGIKGQIKPIVAKKETKGEILKKKKEALDIKCLWESDYNPEPVILGLVDNEIVIISGDD